MADDPLGDKAAFAARFQGTTNLEQRRRYAQDLSDAKARDEERRNAEFEAAQEKNPELMRAVTGRMQENRAFTEGRVKANLAERKFISEQERASRLEAINQKKLELQQMQENRMISKAERELKDAERMEMDTDAFESGEQELRDQGFLPGSQQYRDGLMGLIAQHPYAANSFRQLVPGSKVQLDPEEIQSRIADFTARNPGVAFSMAPDGSITARATASKTGKKELSDLNPTQLARLDKLTKEQAEIMGQPEKRRNQQRLAYLTNEIAALDKQRQAIAAAKQPADAPVATEQPVVPKSFEAAAAAVLPGQTFEFGGKVWRKPQAK
jgi:hypothetical protein